MTARIRHQPRQQPIRLTTPQPFGEPRLPDVAGECAPSTEMLRWVRDVLTETAPSMTAEVGALRVLRHGPKRLAVLESTDGTGVVLKQYSDDRGAWTRRWLQRLAQAGLAPPARFTVTTPRGWSGTHRTLVTDVAPGDPWADWLLAPAADRAAAAVAAADWLTALQALPVALPDRTGYRAEDGLRRESGRLAVAHPRHAPRLFRVADAAHGLLYGNLRSPGPGLVASHGDLHPENLYMAAGGPLTVTAIDVDTAGLRRPAYDVGYALAQLLIISWLRTGSFSVGAGAGLAFWRRWSTGDGTDAEAVPAEIVRALVQSLHFELITYRTGRTELLDRWLDVAEAVLADGVPTTLSALPPAQESTP